MSTINYAIEIITDTTLTDAPNALVDGVFRFITGRPGYAGAPVYPTWEDTTDNTYAWYEGWLTKDGMATPSRRVDITQTGDYGTNSGFTFNIRNDEKFWDYIETNEIWLSNRQIKFYVVVDDVFYQTWTGVISNQPYSETEYTFECVDTFKTIHREMPPYSVNETDDPTATGTAQGEIIPVTVGNIKYAKLTKIINVKNVLDLVMTNGVTYKSCAGVGYFTDGQSGPDYQIEISLYTNGMKFTANELVGKYLVAINGQNANKERLVRIRANSVTTTYDKIDLWTGGNPVEYKNVTLTKLGLDDPLEYATPADFKATDRYVPGVNNNSDSWFFSIIDFSVTLTPSNSLIQSYVKDANNRILVYTYDQTTGVFSHADDRISAVENTTMPKFRITYSDLTWTASSTNDYVTSPAGTFLTDGWVIGGVLKISGAIVDSNNAQYTIKNVTATVITFTSVNFVSSSSDVGVPVIFSTGSINISIRATSITQDGQVEVVSQIPYTATFSAKVNCDGIFDKDNSKSFTYMRDAVEQWRGSYPFRVYPDTDYDFSKVNELYIAPNMTFKPTQNPVSFCDIAMRYDAIDCYGNAIIDLSVQNDPFYSNWGLPAVGSSNTLNMIPKDYFNETAPTGTYGYAGGDIISTSEKRLDMCKLPGEILDAVKSGQVKRIDVYVLFRRSQSTSTELFNVDFNEIGMFGTKSIGTLDQDLYVSLKGELSGADPTVDVGTVYGTFNHILKDYDEISAASLDFDNLPTTRADWPVSRQITEKKNSYDYLKELAEQSFVCIYPTRTGKRKLKAWREDDTIAFTHTDTTILRDSIKSFQKTSIVDLYNAFSFQYSYNYATKKYDRTLYVTNVDSTAFPASTSDTWKTFVGGVNAGSYADAQAIWTICHAAWVKSKSILKAPDSITKLSWYADQADAAGSASPGVSVDNSPWKFLVNCAEWSTRQKDIVTYSLPITATNLTIEMLDFIHFSDAIFTKGTERPGWITAVSVDTKNDTLLLEATLDPIELNTDGVIIERGIFMNIDTITEGINQTDTITEG